jgi:phosphatidylinositol glycan class N
VFRKVEEFLNYARTDAALNEKLNQDKIVFFLHLLGLDTAGHTHKPHSV